ncbi:MAG: NAD(P)H-dependent oxidoreductase [Sneathiella sp.]|nr:NAD(P)H-dependent oxidoreductase [Sneathiella sp.]
MNSKRILTLNGHPADTSLSDGLISAYLDGTSATDYETRRHDLSKMSFDPDIGSNGYGDPKPLEDDLEKFLSDLEWCEHFVIASPLWWGGMPSKLKGLFDRTLLPGRAFDPRIMKAGLPKPLLTGKTARILLTSDTPNWAFSLMYSWAARKQMERQILKFIGIKPIKFSNFAPAGEASREKIDQWMNSVRDMGRKAA